MKLVSESLNHTHFERGKDPRKTMDIGMNPLVKEIDSMDLFWLFQATDLTNGNLVDLETFSESPYLDSDSVMEIYDRVKKDYQLIGSHLEWIEKEIDTIEKAREIHEKAKSEGKYAYDFTPEGDSINAVISEIELPSADLVIETAGYLDATWGSKWPHTNESINFERGREPKRSLRIGQQHLIPEITSDDLEELSMVSDGDDFVMSFDDYLDFNGVEPGNKDEFELLQKKYERAIDIHTALSGQIEIGKFFDWKEFDQLRNYTNNHTPEDKSYIYNAFPGGDGIHIVFSGVELPSAEAVDPDDPEFDEG